MGKKGGKKGFASTFREEKKGKRAYSFLREKEKRALNKNPAVLEPK